MKTVARRICRLEARLAQRIAAKQRFNAKQILIERIESLAVRLRTGGHAIPETGPLADATRLNIQEWLARVQGCEAAVN